MKLNPKDEYRCWGCNKIKGGRWFAYVYSHGTVQYYGSGICKRCEKKRRVK